MNLTRLAFVSLLISCTISAYTYQKYLVNDPDAKCLDGSTPVYYLKQGNQSKWIINFEGGGWCGSPAGISETVEDCYQRSLTDYGSSKNYPNTFLYSDGIFGDNPANYFKDWTIVYFKYCTGTGHQGYSKDPIQYKDTRLYFRGHNATIGMLRTLVDRHAFNNAQQVMVHGQSAGGLATYIWSEYIAQFSRKVLVFDIWSVPDSGIFLDSTNVNSKKHDYKQIFLNFMELSNKEVDPPNESCVKANPNEKWKCMFAEYNYKYITIPLFAIQSPYDTWCLPNILGLYCAKGLSLAGCQQAGVMNVVEQYHSNNTRLLNQIASNPKNGYWAPSCANHCYTYGSLFYDNNYRIPANSVNSLSKSIENWLNKVPGNNSHADSGNWPTNKPCSGVSSYNYNLMKQ